MKGRAAQCVFVGTAVEIQPLQLFWRAISGGPDHHVRCGETTDVPQLPGYPEVGQLDSSPRAGVIEQNVRGFDVAVQQSAGMRVIQRVGDRRDDLEHLLRRHPGAVPTSQQVRHVGALHILHRKPQLPVELATIVDTDDVRMGQPRRHVGFPAEPLPVLVVGGELRGQDFQRVVAGQPRMLSEVHLTHAAGPEKPHDRVSGEHIAFVETPVAGMSECYKADAAGLGIIGQPARLRPVVALLA